MAAVHSNIFCSRADLHTEADVEVLVAERLFALLRYPDDKIHRKEALDEIEVPRGSQKEAYRPDYVLLDSRGRPRVVFDAKSPNETPENYRYQVAGYALGLNSRFSGENPIRLVVVSNGITTVVWPWDDAKPILQLQFSDFDPDNTKFIQLRSLLSYDATAISEAVKDVFEFRRPPMAELLSTFDAAHQLIWKKEKLGPTDAFYEFTKLIFVKLREDQRISRKISYGEPVGLADFNFSTHWIAEQQDRGIDDNPVANSLFRRIREELEHSIQEGNKKRIFADGEGVNLKPSTVTEVVKLFQNYNLHGIDEDLNGRMFETFLNATVRGKELGQFFTPRSVVKYMAQCAPLDVDRHRTPRVLDGCCGSGGFLIEAMALLTHKIIALDQLTSAERTNRLRELHQERLYGIEANDKVTRVSRLNMYLHGDGGSRIYTADTLDKSMFVEAGIDDESQRWLRELRAIIVDRSVRFNVVLTNPPFSMSYKRTDPTESAIIKMYDVATTSSVRSNVLFLERYLDLLDEDGELLTVIDNTVLNGKDQQHVRDFLLKNFIIRQVVALPFNTFFRAQANVQTSILHLRKKRVDEAQGSIFMGILNNVGHNDGQHQTPKRDNTGRLFGAWTQWNNAGSIEEQSWPNESNDENLGCPCQIFVVKANDLDPKRLDAFYYAPALKRVRQALRERERRGELRLRKGSDFQIVKKMTAVDVKAAKGRTFRYFEIGDTAKDGQIVTWKEGEFTTLPTRGRLQVRKGDVLFAKNNSSRGRTVIVPPEFDGQLATTGFIAIRPRSTKEGFMLWNVLSSEVFRQQVYYLAVTASQPEIREDIFAEQFMVPIPEDDAAMLRCAQEFHQGNEQARAAVTRSRELADDMFSEECENP